MYPKSVREEMEFRCFFHMAGMIEGYDVDDDDEIENEDDEYNEECRID